LKAEGLVSSSVVLKTSSQMGYASVRPNSRQASTSVGG
jgi:hypothetical protein